jgi:hypothetical protein
MTPTAILWEFEQIMALEDARSGKQKNETFVDGSDSFNEYLAAEGITPEKLAEAKRRAKES